MPNYSIVEYFVDDCGYKCGYCKNASSAHSQGMWAHSLNVEDYQQLIDRGWRRSGKYCYKPTMKVTCCPQYTIRCHANSFKFSKSKKKIAKKMHQFLVSGGQNDLDNWKKRCQDRIESGDFSENDEEKLDNIPNIDDNCNNKTLDVKLNSEATAVLKVEVNSKDNSQQPIVSTSHSDKVPSSHFKEVRKGSGPNLDKPPCRKAKEIRMERKRQKLQEGASASKAAVKATSKHTPARTLESSLSHITLPTNAKHKLEVKLVRVGAPNGQFERTQKESFRLYQKYQCIIHKDNISDCTERQWKRFLVDSPLHYDSGGPGPGFGSFHNQYWLDDKLIAVGVVDILPKCTSSVYLYYDPDYGFLSLGIYSALSEIHLVKQLQAQLPSMEYYYLGYYIHSCQKMRYKGAYDPSDLLCPETFEWVPISKCIETLDKQVYARLNVLNGGSPDEIDADGVIPSLNRVQCLWQRSIVDYGAYKRFKDSLLFSDRSDSTAEEEDDEVRHYASLVGKTCAERMLLYRA